MNKGARFLPVDTPDAHDPRKTPPPGYKWYMTGDEGIFYQNDVGEQYIVVLGERYLVTANGDHRLKQDIAAVVQGPDANIYGSLQWKDAYRGHPSILMGKQLIARMLSIGCTILAVLAGGYFIPLDGLPWVITVAVTGVVTFLATIFGFTFWFFSFGSRRKELLAAMRTKKLIRAQMANGVSADHYIDLMSRLMHASSRDKAAAAAEVLPWLRRRCGEMPQATL